MLYEAHITMVGDFDTIKKVVEITDWSFSVINGDIDLGKGIRCYATRHFNTKEDGISALNAGRVYFNSYNYIKVIRTKLEEIILDNYWDKNDNRSD